MANILDYLDWRGDLPMHEQPFNPVDALILAQLSYIPCDKIVPDAFSESITIADTAAAFEPEAVDEKQISFCYEQDQILLKNLAESARFRDIRLTGYTSRTDTEHDTQFSAVTCLLPNDAALILFRGTDGSIVGWKEDFNLSFMTETPGQRFAVEYINAFAGITDKEIWTGGHSKGGNFAVYGAMFCDEALRGRIKRIYNFDGPGFRDEIAESEEYKAIIPKTISIIPQSSLVGQLLTNQTEHRIVTSKAYGIAQHLAYAWEVMRDDFVYADELSKFGVFINRTMTGWLNDLDDTAREAVTEAVFDVIQASEKDTFFEMQQHKLRSARAILKAMRTLAPEQQAMLKDAIAKLAAQSKEALFPDKKSEKKSKKEETPAHPEAST